MKKATVLAVSVALAALAMPDGGADAKRIKLKTNDNWKLSCNTARNMVKERGFNPVKVKSCLSTVYSFYATRGSRTHIFFVDSRTGALWQG
jgi:hypothetical protein